MGLQFDPSICTRTREEKAISLVYGYIKSQDDTPVDFDVQDVKLVWFNKTLQNWKALVADITKDGKFFEVTYNGDKKETYIDVYVKLKNFCIKDEG